MINERLDLSSEKKDPTPENPNPDRILRLDSLFNGELTTEDLPKEFDSWTNLYDWWNTHYNDAFQIKDYICIPVLGSGQYTYHVYSITQVMQAMFRESIIKFVGKKPKE